jgi:hypothetical protein
MDNENQGKGMPVYSLVSLEEFMTILGIDDREHVLSRFCLTTSTYTIEQYCKRRFLLKRHFERIEVTGDLLLPLREYPVREVLAVYGVGGFAGTGELLEPELYRVIPDLEGETGEGPEDTVYSLSLSPALKMLSLGFTAVKAVYRAGYSPGEVGDPYGVPADLVAACLELAAWNMSRYRGRRIGMTGAVRGSGEHPEMSMPENVRQLLEAYRRRTI